MEDAFTGTNDLKVKAMLLFAVADIRGISVFHRLKQPPSYIACCKCRMSGFQTYGLETDGEDVRDAICYGHFVRHLLIDSPLRQEWCNRLGHPKDEHGKLISSLPPPESTSKQMFEDLLRKVENSNYAAATVRSTGVKGRSELSRLPYFDISKHCINDPMHMIVNLVKNIFEWVCSDGKKTRMNSFLNENRMLKPSLEDPFTTVKLTLKSV